MARQNKVNMPQSTAGLIRYFDESQESIKLKPEHVAIACAGLVALVIMMKFIVPL